MPLLHRPLAQLVFWEQPEPLGMRVLLQFPVVTLQYFAPVVGHWVSVLQAEQVPYGIETGQ
jgi:hypothetical protein